ncbi:MAG TPA: DUF423 domain-containing protein [Chitinophagaceae bacterium]|nr:DUF423 domain-containing protein [Chitinophagaceae bacterium]
MHRPYLIIAALFGALAVIIGAFGAHSVKAVVTPDVLDIYETGVKYQFYHTFALLSVGILYAWFPGKLLSLAGLFFIIGIVLFSGSLYLITALKAADKVITPAVGIITPVGGLFFIAGWILLLFGILSRKPT